METVFIKPTEREEFIINIAKFYASGSDFVEGLIKNSAPVRTAIIDVYVELVKTKGLTPIEKLDDETILQLQTYSVNIQPKTISEPERLNICRCIWLLNFVFENYIV